MNLRFQSTPHFSHSHLLLMALNNNHFYKLGYQPLPPIIITQASPVSDYAFPTFAIVVLSILATVLLLLAYFTFLTKCCSNWHQLNPLRWINISVLRARENEDPFIALSPTMWNRGLDESTIREIPSFQFIKGEGDDQTVYGCVVCLIEFQEHDVLKILPSCNHAFHLDCIDVWLQTNANCPLCRSSISGSNTYSPFEHFIAPSSSPQDFSVATLSNMGSDEDFVVIELRGEREELLQQVQMESSDSRGSLGQSRNHSTRKVEQQKKYEHCLKPRKCHHVSIMGDECIDIRKKDDPLFILPIRRSFSMDSAKDRQVYLDVQAILQQNRHQNEASASEDCNSRSRRAFFPFCYGKGSRNAVLPLENFV